LEWQVAEGGGRIIENDQTISVNNPGAIRAWERAARWVGSISPPGVLAFRELDSMNAYNSGQAAFRRSWQSEFRLSHWQETALGGVVGFTSVPSGPGGSAATLGGTGLAVSKWSSHPLEAIRFVRSLIRQDVQSRLQTDRSAPPPQPELYDLPAELQPFPRPADVGQEGSGLIARPSVVSGRFYEEVTKAYMLAVHSVLTRERSAPEAAANLEKKLVEITGFKTGPPASHAKPH
jgi:trehalose/maltose transport system substrate-binding protein